MPLLGVPHFADPDDRMRAGGPAMALPVPRATYTGWTPRAQGFGPTALYPLRGTVVPFAATEAARQAANDPRPSLAARYADDAAYVAAVRQEAARQQAERLVLEEDAVKSGECREPRSPFVFRAFMRARTATSSPWRL